MNVATNSHIVKRRIEDYVWRDESLYSRKLRHALKFHFQKFDNVAIVGGMVRDFARIGKEGFNSDIDLVIDAPTEHVADFAKSIHARTNFFGGHSTNEFGWNIDFWALESTWAIREGYVSANCLADFTRSTFFDYDAILYDINKRQLIHNNNYLQNLQRKVMEINLLPNPAIIGNLYRAVIRIILWDLEPGNKLKSFIVENLNDSSFRAIVAMDNRKQTNPFLHKYKNAKELCDLVINRRRY